MAFRNDSYSFHYSGLEGLWKRVAFWGAVGVICAFVHPVPWPIAGMLVLAGIFVGTFTAWRLYHLSTRWIELMRWAVLLLLLGYCIAQGSFKSALGYLAVGSFFSVVIDLVAAFLVPMALSKAEESAVGRSNFLNLQNNLPPLVMDASAARKAFLEALPQPLRGDMAKTFVTATIISPQKGADSLAPEVSSFGGQPFMLPELPWPKYEERSLKFLAQINLGEVAALLPEGLPKHGLLSFFVDQEEQPWGQDPSELGAGRILYSTDVSQCVIHAADEREPLKARQPLRFHHEIVQDISYEQEGAFYAYFHALKPGQKASLSQLHDCVCEKIHFDNRLFSTPGLIQNEIPAELKIASEAHGLPENTVWTMVLQLGSVEEQDWCWGDAGCLYFWVPEMDLQAARFDRSWVFLQCS